ncbi:MAG TPA: DUF1990 domain-containing protein [Prosthecobacter sp.]|nr:DUF1990 domain-containing protein [Prosthecobacter sp.]
MPILHLPPPDALRSWLASSSDEPLSYVHSGGVDHPPASGFIDDTHRVFLGQGEAVYQQAQQALRAWRVFPEWAGLFPPDQPQEPGRIVATVIKIMRLWWVNPCRILHRIDENEPSTRRCGFVYGTLPRHAECGEERFLVQMLPDGAVWYEIRAFSRPRHWLAWLGFPLARWWQLRFVRDSQAAMLAATSASS